MKKKLNPRTGHSPGSGRQGTLWKDITNKCKHKWQPLSFVFETQLLDPQGRVKIRQPDISNAQVFCVCMKCCAHTYIVTGWIGYYIGSPDLLEEAEQKGLKILTP